MLVAHLVGRACPGRRSPTSAPRRERRRLTSAQLMANRGRILAFDRDPSRLASVREAAARLGITDRGDAGGPGGGAGPRGMPSSCDVVLVDAPCSNLGVLRRHPEVKWRRQPAELAESATSQRAILQAAADMVRPGGRLVYATCSLEPEENDAVVRDLLSATRRFHRRPADRVSDSRPTRPGSSAVFPHRHGTDGFTAVRVRRTRDPAPARRYERASRRGIRRHMVKIAPSILAADFGILAEEIARVEAAGADQIHIDVMDGRFVPNISMGFPILEAVRKRTRLPLDLHLMIVEPERYLADFAAAGADMLTVHVEACPHLQRTLTGIREQSASGAASGQGGRRPQSRHTLRRPSITSSTTSTSCSSCRSTRASAASSSSRPSIRRSVRSEPCWERAGGRVRRRRREGRARATSGRAWGVGPGGRFGGLLGRRPRPGHPGSTTRRRPALRRLVTASS